MGKTIYLSPSNQYNKTTIDGVTEKMLMEPVARAVFTELEKYDCTPVYPTVFDKDGSYTGRPAEAQRKGADYYVAIHSNSSGIIGAYATGCVGYYHGSDDVSKKLARAIRIRLDASCPIKSNRANGLVDGMQVFGGYGYGELREPKKLGMTPVLIETNFHSYDPTCRYLYENPFRVGLEIATAIAETLGLAPKDESVSAGTGETGSPADEEKPEKEWKPTVGEVVYFTGNTHYSSSYPQGRPLPAKPGKAVVIGLVSEESEKQPHSVQLIAEDGGGSNVYGWVDRADVRQLEPDEPIEEVLAVGDEVRFRSEALVYYPTGSTIPDWVKNDYTHVITQTLYKGEPVKKGGKTAVLLGKKRSVKTGEMLAGINTWADISNLVKV